MARSKDDIVLIIAYLSIISVVRCDEPEIGEKCLHTELGQHCYTLYGSLTSAVTWSEARAQCQGHGKQLVAITSSNVQETLVELIQPIKGTGGTVHVWTSGIKSENKNWFQVNNASVPQEVLDKFKYGVQPDRCAIITKSSEDKPLDHKECDDRFDRCLCQGSSPCGSDEVSYNGLCYNVRVEQQIDWNKARQLCRSKTNRDLAYSHVTDLNLLSKFDNITYTWIGLSSRNWIWDNDGSRMVYTQFRSGVSSDSCVSVDANDDGKWGANNCEDDNKYFICEKTTETSLSTTTTTSTTSTTTRTTSTTTSTTLRSTSPPVTPTTREGNTTMNTSLVKNENTSGLQQELIVLPVVVVVIVIVGVVIAAYVMRRRRRQPKNPRTTEHVQGNTISSEYEDVSDVMTAPEPGHDGATYEELKGRTHYENSAITGPYASLSTRRDDIDQPHEAESNQ